MNYKRYYIENSMVFVTIVTCNRNSFLLENVDLIKSALLYTKTKYDFSIIAFVILDNHIHMVLYPSQINNYPNIIKCFKANFSRNFEANKEITIGKLRKREKGIWQSRYWARIIVNQNDLYKHLDYIHYNPIKHGYAKRAKDWEYSSFKKFVDKNYYDENWCNLEDKNKILAMEVE